MVVNLLYDTELKEASEFSRARKGKMSLVEWAFRTFGSEDARTKYLQEVGAMVRGSRRCSECHESTPVAIAATCELTTSHWRRTRSLREPVWYRERGGKVIDSISSIGLDMTAVIHNLLVLGEDVLVSWAKDHLCAPRLMQIIAIPSERRDPKCPVKYDVTASDELERMIAEAENKKV